MAELLALPVDTVAVNHRQEVSRVGDGIGQESCQLALMDLGRLCPQELTETTQKALGERDQVDWVLLSVCWMESLPGNREQKVVKCLIIMNKGFSWEYRANFIALMYSDIPIMYQ